ncbi:MAG UNVERIFIED_CONTAM: ABC transporter permease [Planctomycetaceae bacterium]
MSDSSPLVTKRPHTPLPLRLARLARKELRESLRDRRTLATLVLMPLIVYPLLGMVIQKFAVSRARAEVPEAVVLLHDQIPLQEAALMLRELPERGSRLRIRQLPISSPPGSSPVCPLVCPAPARIKPAQHARNSYRSAAVFGGTGSGSCQAGSRGCRRSAGLRAGNSRCLRCSVRCASGCLPRRRTSQRKYGLRTGASPAGESRRDPATTA